MIVYDVFYLYIRGNQRLFKKKTGEVLFTNILLFAVYLINYIYLLNVKTIAEYSVLLIKSIKLRLHYFKHTNK